MHTLFPRLMREDDGSHVLEYALLAVGLSTALLEPSLFVSAWYRLSDTLRLLAGHVVTMF